MKTTFFAVLFAATASLASLASPAFASNYGPAPFYRPSVSDARPVPQAATSASNDAGDAQQAYGGMNDSNSQSSAGRHMPTWQQGLFAHH
ncbi:hypothetical protein [Paraburkholderia rhizosphaerae]|uniref:PXPV repeat-containing protein n=1 Tax=Paraburkholderia rhizosphaerae TaxID=480658 RepID=A0A4R8LXG8_9BURK|nr:hypothetical protein [Paraburkholderia rhizosphaerae]TDY51507.1 hypothetical protein BX592_10775 [Paraburkholderia rhizosphaerae]